MKYILYIDYRAHHGNYAGYEYRCMNAKNIAEAIIEADESHNPETMYLIRIMEKSGKIEKVESDIKAQTYKAIMEKRSSKWAATTEMEHRVKRFMAKFGDWFNLA